MGITFVWCTLPEQFISLPFHRFYLIYCCGNVLVGCVYNSFADLPVSPHSISIIINLNLGKLVCISFKFLSKFFEAIMYCVSMLNNVCLYVFQRWQRRFFVLYDDGELTYSVDENVSRLCFLVVDSYHRNCCWCQYLIF